MFPSITLLLLISIALIVVDAGPVGRTTGTLTLVTRTTFNEHGNQTFPDIDLARAQAHALQERDKVGFLGVKHQNFHCTVDIGVGVGTSQRSYTVLISMGTAITWLSEKAYVKTSTITGTGKTFKESLVDNVIEGDMYDDHTVTLGDLVIPNQSIGIATKIGPRAFSYQGILGLGPVALTESCVSDHQPVPTVMDNLVAQGQISKNVLGIYFVPSTEQTAQGALTFGGFDHRATRTPMHYVEATKIFSAGKFLGIEQSITYGHKTILPSNVGIIDTGTTLVMLSTNAFGKYQEMTGAIKDDTTGMLTITPQQYDNLQDLTFNIGGRSFTLTPNAQIWPRSRNNLLPVAGRSDAIYLIVTELSEATARDIGFHFIIGYTFIQRFYTVFDMPKRWVGLAETQYTYAMIN